MACSSALALNGGSPVVTIENPEQWRRPIDEELRLIRELLETGNISGEGPGSGMPDEFETAFKKYIGAKYCMTMDHGSTALSAAFYAAGVGPGDEVIVPTIGYLGTYGGALHMGARPVFCEPDPETLLIDPMDAERRITEKTRAIACIHAGGNVCDMDALLEIGRKHGVAIVEDGAHIHGAEWDGKKIGSFGDVTCFSLQGVTPSGKPVAGGEGGIITTQSREYYERILAFGHLHRSGLPGEFTLEPYTMLDAETLGQKLRAHPLGLAVAKVSLDSLDDRIMKNDNYRERVFEAIGKLPGLRPEGEYAKARRISLYDQLKVIYDPAAFAGLPVSRFVEALQAEGAPVKMWGWHLEHMRSIFRNGYDWWGEGRGPLGDGWIRTKPGDYPLAEDLMSRTIGIPDYVEPVDGFVEQIVEAFEKVVGNYRQLL